jgi:hypothetical protein
MRYPAGYYQSGFSRKIVGSTQIRSEYTVSEKTQQLAFGTKTLRTVAIYDGIHDVFECGHTKERNRVGAKRRQCFKCEWLSRQHTCKAP